MHSRGSSENDTPPGGFFSSFPPGCCGFQKPAFSGWPHDGRDIKLTPLWGKSGDLVGRYRWGILSHRAHFSIKQFNEGARKMQYPIHIGVSGTSLEAAAQDAVTKIGQSNIEVEILSTRAVVDGTGTIWQYRVQAQQSSHPFNTIS